MGQALPSLVTMLVGAIVGFLVGLTSVGSGTLIIVSLASPVLPDAGEAAIASARFTIDARQVMRYTTIARVIGSWAL